MTDDEIRKIRKKNNVILGVILVAFVVPYSAGYYFNKIQCFCFEMQVLQPGETVQMPVTFYVDPEIIDDREAKFVNNITLSYTFHATDLPTDQASLASSVQSTVNKPES